MNKEFKVVTVGESGAGKTTIINRFSSGDFSQDEKPTIGSGTTVAHVDVDGKSVKLNVWDTAGQEKFNSLLPLYFRNSHAVILVFDITQKIDDVKSFYARIENDIPNNALLYLVGNKSDLLNDDFDIIPYEEWAHKTGMIFFRTSAKTGDNINRLFARIACDCSNQDYQNVHESDYTKEIIGDETPKPEKKCC